MKSSALSCSRILTENRRNNENLTTFEDSCLAEIREMGTGICQACIRTFQTLKASSRVSDQAVRAGITQLCLFESY